MALIPGTRLGPYEVGAQIGAGGMGEVYRATDTNLRRSVAIKILPEALARDPERLARFQREAEVLASLNHPNIAQIYGIEKGVRLRPSGAEDGGIRGEGSASVRAGGGAPAPLDDVATTGLVMELVEGPTLADLIAQGTPEGESLRSSPRDKEGSVIARGSPEPSRRAERGATALGVRPQRNRKGGSPRGLKIDDALAIAKQIAEALEAAHERGIVHRDLKPANVKVRPDGAVKVLDFGLAKALERKGGSSESSGSGGLLTQSPTIMTPAQTMQGVILGTAAYMSPEQARGERVDGRTDVWAFGCVLFEMLAGARPFDGPTVSDTIAAVLRGEPDWNLLPSGLHPRVRLLLQRCLEKASRNRYHGIADARVDIEQVLRDPAGAAPRTQSTTAAGPRPGKMITAVALASAITLLAAWAATAYLRPTSGGADVPAWAAEPIRFSLAPPPNTTFYPGSEIPFAVSPDGRQIVFEARTPTGRPQLWVQALRADDARPLQGTEDAASPFWSPDSVWIGFFTDDGLKRVPVAGGEPQTVVRVAGSRGTRQATWSADGTIVFQTYPGRGLSQVSAEGGAVSPASVYEDGDVTHIWPKFMDDGRHFLFARGSGAIAVGSLDAVDQKETLAVDLGNGATLGYSPGYLLYYLGGGLFARPFDEATLGFSGPPVRILDGIPRTGPGRVPYSVSRNGVLAYWMQQSGEPAEFRWIARDGTASAPLMAAAQYSGWGLDPGATRLAFSRQDATGRRNVWIRDLARGDEQLLTAGGDAFSPIWSPDGRSVVFTSAGGHPPNLFRRPLDTGTDEALTHSPSVENPRSWDAIRGWVVYQEQDPDSGGDLWRVSLDDGAIEPLPVNTAFNEDDGQVSPDGRYLAYVSNESGANEVILAAFPSGQPRRTVSIAGGDRPRWRPDGRELYYVSADERLMAVQVGAGDTGIQISAPEPLFTIVGDVNQPFEPAADGQRFLFLTRAEDAGVPPIRVILNWPALLN